MKQNSSIIIVDNQNGKIFIHTLTKPMTMIGSSNDCDIILNGLPKSGFSILKESSGHRLISMFEKNVEPSIPWNKTIKDVFPFKLGHFFFVLFPDVALQSPGKDELSALALSSSLLPKDPLKNPKDKNFPSCLLQFILSVVGAEQGALFYFEEMKPKELATVNFQVDEESTAMLTKYLSDNSEKWQKINFQTHSMIFATSKITKSKIPMSDFILLRQSCLDKGEVALYIPMPSNKVKTSETLLTTLLYLSSHALSLHVIYKYHENISGNTYMQSGLYWGQTPKMVRLKQLSERLAKTDLSILILGETGVGKEGIAKYLVSENNKQSGISKQIVSVNCAAIPLGLAESILFGHVKGSFTGANNNQRGKFQEANNGILFLDEIGELNLEIQGKLLRVLQDGIVTPVGGKSEKVKVRIIAATHQDILLLIKQKKFREDLYYRLNEATLHIPPLRERSEDIIPLSHFFLKEVITANNLPEISFARTALERLKSYAFPGNIRELRSIVRRAAILNTSGVISAEEISELLNIELQNSASSAEVAEEFFSRWPFPKKLEQAKRLFLKHQIAHALKVTNDNKTKAAENLGITARTLFRILAELNSSELNVFPHDIDVTSESTFS
ncbi:MAG: sigma-54-dependent Fis family transcriptional regulator [Oligoflexia bacterium]|nr:sigma-54-dependent Fis family transcriptional regulator [Oligoflexia bacterium]